MLNTVCSNVYSLPANIHQQALEDVTNHSLSEEEHSYVLDVETM